MLRASRRLWCVSSGRLGHDMSRAATAASAGNNAMRYQKTISGFEVPVGEVPKELHHIFTPPDESNPQDKYTGKWLIENAPAKLQPYLRLSRLDKPVGTYLLFFPSAFAICMAAPSGGFPEFKLMLTFLGGSYVMRSAGCIINDLWDKDLDKHVERTKDRPLASGELTTNQALGWLSGHIAIGLGILSTLNPAAWYVGLGSFFWFTLYPLMKRYTNYPQAWLGVTFNWGVPLGWAAATGGLAPLGVILPLHFGCWCWTMIYDTLYAYQDRKDDLVAGIKSTAVAWDDESSRRNMAALAVASGASIAAAGMTAGLPLAWLGAPALWSGHLLGTIYGTNFNNAEECGNAFKVNVRLGMVMTFLTALAAVKGDGYVREKDYEEEDRARWHGINWVDRGLPPAEDRYVDKVIDVKELAAKAVGGGDAM